MPEKIPSSARWYLPVFFLWMSGLMVFSLVEGVFSTPYFQSGHPRATDFNDRFSTANTYYAAARDLVNGIAEGKVPSSEQQETRRQAITYLETSLQHRPRNAYAWHLKASQELALGHLDAAVRSWRTSNRLALYDVSLTVPRLQIATRLWRQLTPDDHQQMYKQIRAAWQIRRGHTQLVIASLESSKRRRIIRTALKDMPDALSDYRTQVQDYRKRRRRN